MRQIALCRKSVLDIRVEKQLVWDGMFFENVFCLAAF